jgi:predicted Zn-dependent peptidase
MKRVTKILILFIASLSINVAFAQNSMKAPIRYKLKNGLNIVVAQNTGLGKIYSRLTIENEAKESNSILAQILETYLNNKANSFNELMAGNDNNISKITMSLKEANTATNVANFEQALNYIANTFLNLEITSQSFSEIKDLYTGNKADLGSITLKNLQDYYSKNYSASDAFITIAGDINPSYAKEITAKAFGNWSEITSL